MNESLVLYYLFTNIVNDYLFDVTIILQHLKKFNNNNF
jgi:hypothetical protein